MGKVVFDQKVAMGLVVKAQKRLIAIGLSLERDIKLSISGPGPVGAPPGVDTGRLRASISTNWVESSMGRGLVGSQADTSEGVGKPEKEDRFVVVVGTNVKYAPYLEFGTRRMGPRPFVRPAFDRMRHRLLSLISKEIPGER